MKRVMDFLAQEATPQPQARRTTSNECRAGL